MLKQKPIEEAPRNREILVYNTVVGWYKTKYKDGEWPLTYWGRDGLWFPRPTLYKELE